MSFTLKSNIRLAALLVAAGTVNAYAGDSADIHFVGQVDPSTCQINVNNGNDTITLDSVDVLTAKAATSEANMAGKKPFSVAVDCSGLGSSTTLTSVTGKLTTSGEIDAATNAVKNTDSSGAAGVGFVVYDETAKQTVDFSTVSANQPMPSNPAAGPNPTFNYSVGYVAYDAENVSSGPIKADISFEMTYQ